MIEKEPIHWIDRNKFIKGMARRLNPMGVFTLEDKIPVMTFLEEVQKPEYELKGVIGEWEGKPIIPGWEHENSTGSLKCKTCGTYVLRDARGAQSHSAYCPYCGVPMGG